jgi:hypothetical protein
MRIFPIKQYNKGERKPATWERYNIPVGFPTSLTYNKKINVTTVEFNGQTRSKLGKFKKPTTYNLYQWFKYGEDDE